MLSVLVCTHNNCERLAITLKAISRCTSPPVDWQLIVVANACTDRTFEVVREFKSILPIRFVEAPQKGLSRARNAGLAAAEGELIVFTDDDVKPDKSWLTAYWQAFQQHGRQSFFGGSVKSEYEVGPPSASLMSSAGYSIKGIDFGNQEIELKSGQTFLAANWAAPRAAINRVGGFDESLGLGAHSDRISVGEETMLQEDLLSLGFTAMIIPSAWVWHYVPDFKTKRPHLADRYAASVYQRRCEAIKNWPRHGMFERAIWALYFGLRAAIWKSISITQSTFGITDDHSYLAQRIDRAKMDAHLSYRDTAAFHKVKGAFGSSAANGED